MSVVTVCPNVAATAVLKTHWKATQNLHFHSQLFFHMTIFVCVVASVKSVAIGTIIDNLTGTWTQSCVVGKLFPNL